MSGFVSFSISRHHTSTPLTFRFTCSCSRAGSVFIPGKIEENLWGGIVTGLVRTGGVLLMEVLQRETHGWRFPRLWAIWSLGYLNTQCYSERVANLLGEWVRSRQPSPFAVSHSPPHCVQNLVLQYLGLSVVFSFKCMIQFHPHPPLLSLL